MTNPTSREACRLLDAEDRLAPLREQFEVPPGMIYLDGNSLGPLPHATADRVQRVVRQEWGQDLIQSWNKAGWIEQPQRVGDKIARLVGAGVGQVLATDSTSANLYKVLAVALDLARSDAPQRRVIVSERDNFPTDLYIAQSLARQQGFELRLVETGDLAAQLDERVAALMLTQANYRTGRVHPIRETTAAAKQAGALVLWDLAHSAGAMPVELLASDADFAVGCGYKYLNGGPGSPAFLWVHPRHLARMDAEQRWQPLAGWMGHAVPFDFRPEYLPARSIQRFLCGTPSPLALAALECGVDTLLAAEPLGGMAAVRKKSLALTGLFMDLLEQRCGRHGIRIRTPREPALRGSQVSFELAGQGVDARQADVRGYAVVQALIARGVVGDFRAPGLLRFGFAPLYVRHVDVWDAVEHLVQVLDGEEWRQERFQGRGVVT